MMNIVWFFTGCIVATSFILLKQFYTKDKKSKYIRRGIYTKEFTVITNGNSESVEVQFELGEVESTSCMSKVEVVSQVSSMSKYNTESQKKEFESLVGNSWIGSSEIDWIVDISIERNNKIDKILK